MSSEIAKGNMKNEQKNDSCYCPVYDFGYSIGQKIFTFWLEKIK